MRTRPLITGVLGATLLLSALPAAGFAQDQEEEPFAPEGLTWLLSAYNSSGSMVEVPDELMVTLLLDAGEASGSAGCNAYFGGYEITAESLAFGPLGSTLALCEPPEQDVEDAYLALLPDVAGWMVEGTTLALSDADGAVTLVYDEAPVQIVASDLVALSAELEGLQAQLDALDETVASQNVAGLRNRVAGVEANLESLQNQVDSQNVAGLRERVRVNEVLLNEVADQVTNLRSRVNKLEKQYAALDQRITALEEGKPKPEQPLP